jgi:hypothetical protein
MVEMKEPFLDLNSCASIEIVRLLIVPKMKPSIQKGRNIQINSF